MVAEQIELLLVEDNPTDAELALYALKKGNLTSRIQHVRDGVEALDFIFARGDFAHRNIEEQPRVILLDLKLPRLSGLDVLKRIKADMRTAGIPVVLLSSSRLDSDIAQGYQLGVNSYIVKPVNFEEFTQAIQQIGYYWLHLNRPQCS